jgi:hypothetical protein
MGGQYPLSRKELFFLTLTEGAPHNYATHNLSGNWLSFVINNIASTQLRNS